VRMKRCPFPDTELLAPSLHKPPPVMTQTQVCPQNYGAFSDQVWSSFTPVSFLRHLREGWATTPTETAMYQKFTTAAFLVTTADRSHS